VCVCVCVCVCVLVDVRLCLTLDSRGVANRRCCHRQRFELNICQGKWWDEIGMGRDEMGCNGMDWDADALHASLDFSPFLAIRNSLDLAFLSIWPLSGIEYHWKFKSHKIL